MQINQSTLRDVLDTIRKSAKKVEVFLTVSQGGVAQNFTGQISYVGDDFFELHDPKLIIPYTAIAFFRQIPE